MGAHDSLAKRLFSWVSRLLPFDFRREYGREMELAFASDLEDATQSTRPTRIWRVWVRAIAGVGPVAVREHLAVTRRDVGYALRMLAQQPAFTATALLSISLGIGATTAVFSLIDGLFLQPLPFAADDRLAGLYTIDRRNPGFNPTSFPNYLDYRDGVR